ncbi:hypothetical protein BS47DRAFT_1342409, partial [Hydnum rufescens UP504]
TISAGQPEFKHALQIVKKIKKRFAHETNTAVSRSFTAISEGAASVPTITSLLQSAPDLIKEFEQSPLHLSRILPPSGGSLAAPAATGEI